MRASVPVCACLRVCVCQLTYGRRGHHGRNLHMLSYIMAYGLYGPMSIQSIQSRLLLLLFILFKSGTLMGGTLLELLANPMGLVVAAW